MGSPNTLINRPLNNKDRLKNHIKEFLVDAKFLPNDPKILKIKTDFNLISNFAKDQATLDYYLNKYLKAAVNPLIGEEWILKYPGHYLPKDKTITYVLTLGSMSVLGGSAISGFWTETGRVYAMSLRGYDKSDLYQPLRLPIHELAHSRKIGTRYESNLLLGYDRMDWFTPKYKDSSLLEIIQTLRNNSTAPGLGKMYDSYVINSEADLKSGEHKWFEGKPANAREAFVAFKIIEETFARSIADVAVSNALHDDMTYLFKPGFIETILSPKFIDIIKKGAWPRLPENKPELLDLFRGMSLWD